MKDLTHVDGVEVIERQKAIVQIDDPSVASLHMKPGVAMKTVDQVLLADERIIYQCTHHADPDCTFSADKIRSVTAHQRTHGGKATANRASKELAVVQARADALETELTLRKQRQSLGGKKAAVTRASRRGNAHAMAPSEIGGRGSPERSASTVGDIDLATQAQRVIAAFNAMQDGIDEFQKVFIGYMRAAQSASTPPVIDPQILAKAQQYDAMKAAMKAMQDL